MPTYDYKCDGCDHQFEQFQSIKADALKKCPSCGKNKLRRLIGPGAGLLFKGNGFYITDYRSDSYTKAAKSESGGGASSTSGAGGGETAAKPAAKASEAPKPTSTKKPANPA